LRWQSLPLSQLPGWCCFAEKMRDKLGVIGLNIATRIMGLILAAIGVQFIADGAKQLLPGLA